MASSGLDYVRIYFICKNIWISVVFFCFIEGGGLMYINLCLCMCKEVIVGGVCWMQNNGEVGGGSRCLVEKQCAVMLF